MPGVRKKSAVDWSNILYRGVESDELDYKSAMNWTKMARGARAKIVRHCLALANTKGGYIVIGVGEDDAGHPSVYTGLTREELRSFDPSKVGPFVNSHVEPPIDFTIERPTVDGKRYAILVIRPFSTLPHVCSNGFEGELQQGVFYIRTADAASRAAVRALEMHTLIQRALRNQREILGRMLRGLLYENRSPAESENLRFDDEIASNRQYFLHRHPVGPKQIRLEFTASLPEYDPERFSLGEIRQAVENSLVIFPAGILLGPGALPAAYRTNTAFRMVHKQGGELCQIGQSGLFYYTRLIDVPGRKLLYTELVQLLAEIVNFLSDLYANLSLDEQLLGIKVQLTGTAKLILTGMNRPLSGRGGGRAAKVTEEGTCHISEIEIVLRRTAADLASGREAHAARLIADIAERFNSPEVRQRHLVARIRRYLEKR